MKFLDSDTVRWSDGVCYIRWRRLRNQLLTRVVASGAGMQAIVSLLCQPAVLQHARSEALIACG
jgi:hypothetical protein